MAFLHACASRLEKSNKKKPTEKLANPQRPIRSARPSHLELLGDAALREDLLDLPAHTPIRDLAAETRGLTLAGYPVLELAADVGPDEGEVGPGGEGREQRSTAEGEGESSTFL